MTKPIDSIKIDIISSVSAMNDYEKLLSISKSLHKKSSDSIFEMGSLEVESGISFDSIYESQGSKAILFEDLPTSDEDWGYSLEELLAAI